MIRNIALHHLGLVAIIEIYDTKTKNVLKLLKRREYETKNYVKYSPDSKNIITMRIDENDKINVINLLDLEKVKVISNLKGWSNEYWSIGYSFDRKYIATGSRYNTVRLWEASSGNELKILSGHSDIVTSVYFSPDGKKIISASNDKTIKIWDVESGKEIKNLSGHTDIISSITFSEDWKNIISISRDKTIKIWDIENGREIKTIPFEIEEKYLSKLYTTHNFRYIISLSADRIVKIWDVLTQKEKMTFNNNSTQFSDANFSPDGKYIVYGENEMVKVLDIENGREVNSLIGHAEKVRCANYSPDGRHIISCSNEGNIKLWDAKSYNLICSIASAGMELICWTPEGIYGGNEILATDLCIIKGMKLVNAGQFKNILNRPDLIEKKIGGKDITDYTKTIDFKKIFEEAELLPEVEIKEIDTVKKTEHSLSLKEFRSTSYLSNVIATGSSVILTGKIMEIDGIQE